MQLKLKLTVAAAIASVAGLASAQDTQVVKIGHVRNARRQLILESLETPEPAVADALAAPNPFNTR